LQHVSAFSESTVAAALVSAEEVLADTVWTDAGVLSAFIDVFACGSGTHDPHTSWTLALVATRCVETSSSGAGRWVPFFTFIDIFAHFHHHVISVARIAGAAKGSDGIHTLSRPADARADHTLINVHAHGVRFVHIEPCVALTLERTRHVYALPILADFLEVAFVDIRAVPGEALIVGAELIESHRILQRAHFARRSPCLRES
jgi:hypothetical protein